jgi:plasmid stability protein
MVAQTVTLNVPEPIYARLRERAQRSNRTVEDEALEVLAAVVPDSAELPAELADAIAALKLLDDEELWRAACSSLSADQAAKLEELHLKRQSEGLTDAEAARLAELVRQYERAMLLRARAILLLKERGHDVARLRAS